MTAVFADIAACLEKLAKSGGEGETALDCLAELDGLVTSPGLSSYSLIEFDWTTWRPWPEYLSGARKISAAGLHDALRVGVAMLRQERFVEGTITGMVQSGKIGELAGVFRRAVISGQSPPL